MTKWAVTLLLTFGISGASAKEAASVKTREPSQFSFNAFHESTSDELDHNSLGLSYQNHRRDPHWPYPGEADAAWDLGLRANLCSGKTPYGHYSSFDFFGEFSRKISEKANMGLEAGMSRLSEDRGGSIIIPAGTLSAFIFPASFLSFEVMVFRKLANVDHRPGAVSTHLKEVGERLNIYSQPVERIRVIAQGENKNLSDGNQKRWSDFSLLYGVSPGTPWIWLGMGGELFGYTRNTENDPVETRYWSPGRFISFGPRADIQIPIQGLLSLSIGANWNRLREGDLPWGTGYYLSPSLNYGSRENVLVSVYYTRISSKQGESSWSSNTFGLNALASF